MTAPDPQPEAPSNFPPADRLRPGQVWWCDGVALGFEAHFKRRPVLVLAVQGDTLLVAPLSSRRRHGQEQAVTHEGGVSFLTDRALPVPADALLSPLGAWHGFHTWRESLQSAAASAERITTWLTRLHWWLSGSRFGE